MSDRDRRLVPRLLEALMTLENDGEIAATVRQLRRIGGPEAFKPQHTDTVSLRHPSHIVTNRLRTLGITLRQARINPDPGGENEKLQRIAQALERGDTIGSDDVAFLLSCVMAIIENMRQQAAVLFTATSSTAPTPQPFTASAFRQMWSVQQRNAQQANDFETEELRRRQAELAEQLQRRGS